MGLQLLTSPTTLPSLAVVGNETVGGNLAVTGNAGFYGHAASGQQGPFAVAGILDRAMALATAAGVSTAAATNVAAFGYATQAQADALPVAINALEADVAKLRNNVNAIMQGLQATGMFS